MIDFDLVCKSLPMKVVATDQWGREHTCSIRMVGGCSYDHCGIQYYEKEPFTGDVFVACEVWGSDTQEVIDCMKEEMQDAGIREIPSGK